MSVSDRSDVLGRVKRVADQIIRIRIGAGKPLLFATRIAMKRKVDYNLYSDRLSADYGVTPEKVFRIRLIGKVKELLVYTDNHLSR